MVRLIPDFPCPGIPFRHVLNISQQDGGLELCVSLVHPLFTGNWSNVHAMVSCEAGGFVFASALACYENVPLMLVREAGKLPLPTYSVLKTSSHISALSAKESKEKCMEMEQIVVPEGMSVIVVDDVLSTGATLCAVLQLLYQAGLSADDINVMVVAEFPHHRGRALLRERGFGRVNVQSLLVFGGA
jgi:adenine phosphoribosyltransferase